MKLSFVQLYLLILQQFIFSMKYLFFKNLFLKKTLIILKLQGMHLNRNLLQVFSYIYHPSEIIYIIINGKSIIFSFKFKIMSTD